MARQINVFTLVAKNRTFSIFFFSSDLIGCKYNVLYSGRSKKLEYFKNIVKLFFGKNFLKQYQISVNLRLSHRMFL